MTNHRGRGPNLLGELVWVAGAIIATAIFAPALSGFLALASVNKNPYMLALVGIAILVYLSSLLYRG